MRELLPAEVATVNTKVSCRDISRRALWIDGDGILVDKKIV
jgi:hypothetical protein